MKRLKHILDKYSDEQIISRLFLIYPDQRVNEDGYRKTLTTLRNITPVRSECILHVRKRDITGTIGIDETRYAMEFTPWEEWLSMKVESSYVYLNALCFCLWGMTYMGFDQKKISRKLKMLNKKVGSIL